MTRRRVLIVSAWPPAIGGVASFTERLVGNEKYTRAVEWQGTTNVKWPVDGSAAKQRWGDTWVGRAGSALSIVWNLMRYAWLVASRKPDVIQIHYNGRFESPQLLDVVLYVWLGKLRGCRIVVRHGGRFHVPDAKRRLWRWMGTRWYLEAIDCLMVQWPELGERYRRHCREWGFDLRTIVVPNTVDTDWYVPRRDTAEQERDAVIRVGFVAGPDHERKGVPELLDAIRRLVGTGSVAKEMVFTGIGESDWVRNRVNGDAILRRVIALEGYVSGEKKRRWFQSLDVFVLPTKREGFPNTLLEAMACGLAIVTTPVDAIPWVVRHGEDALLIEPGDVEGLKHALMEMMESEELRNRLGAKARKTAVERFSNAGAWVDAVLKCYEQGDGTTA